MYIVTGGAGFIGSVLVKKLNDRGINDIIIVDNIGTSLKWKNLLGKTYKDYIPKENFLDRVRRGTFPQVKAIIHMGACSATTEEDFDYLYNNNYLYSVELAKWSMREKIRFIYASSAATYGSGANGYVDSQDIELRPLNRYGYSKYIFDQWIKKENLDNSCVGLKFFNVYGPNEYHKGSMASLAYKAFSQIKEYGSLKLFKSHKVPYKDGEQLRDFVYIKDCIDVMLWFLDNPQHNGIFNVGTGKARTWNDLAAAIFKAMNLDYKVEYIDMPMHLRSQYQYFTEASMDKLTKMGFSQGFRSLEEGIRDYYENYLLQENPYL
ncbi:ADP-glyceromanno-heptose 6-epimerase [Candidatus Uabimicrobium amorphum]|uniref:ADP-L-glycero-D-manno-heptose-6-epimerase n=1 Tax=Uabimicrobium amorphum TaxID=2596890 RepID=A0A5S9F0N1_UABAM|nr:ADP-glyceromanno-heptose 6-epimerase [Candidatus Uabimicrobium amorphum]BBM81785.1 ADP-L-glycero-D-manno-heptose-6-epimerase [Candidatus Uabimicrobium amorphum]